MSEIILASSLPVPQPKEQLTFREATKDDFTFIDQIQKHYHNELGFMPTMWLEGKVKDGHILLAESSGERVGYIIAQDRYFKREDVGIVYQLVVKPGKQRGFIGAALLKAQFDRSAYGCRLYCCWCARDIEANQFWESMGFVPLAYRYGSEKKSRVHIFWQKKTRGNEDTINWWFPSKTDQGAMRADRLVFPIPPGKHWKDFEHYKIPMPEQPKALPIKREKKIVVPKQPAKLGIWFPSPEDKKIEPAKEKLKREKKPKIKLDPKFIAFAREVRDRYLEQVNENGYRLESAGKYELTRQIASAPTPPQLLLEAA